MKYYRLILWVIVIGIMCFTPGSKLSDINIGIPHLDKLIHFTLFYGLSVFIKGLNSTIFREELLWYAFAFIYASTSEVIQYYFVEMRSGSFADFIADSAGILAGYLSYKYLPAYLRDLTV